MWLAVRANVRVAAAAMRDNGRFEGARIAFRTGGVVGMSVVGLGLLGAAAVVLTRQSVADAKGAKPVARLVAHAAHAQEPKDFTVAPVGAINKLLAKAGDDPNVPAPMGEYRTDDEEGFIL